MKKCTQAITILFATLLLFSCSEYAKILKSDNLDGKYEYAKKLYEKEKYYKAFII